MAEEEVTVEVEAVEAVYGGDCKVINNYPPHLHVHIKPRTADVSSQQFVEAIVEIRAGPQYPDELPHISIVDSKGLDEERQRHLITSIHDKACELSSYLMLVALCEEAVERLSSMNHPEGDCPLCLSPLLGEGAGDRALPFMKLMSCFHCFHCECIIRWWNWLQVQKETDPARSSGSTLRRGGMETQLAITITNHRHGFFIAPQKPKPLPTKFNNSLSFNHTHTHTSEEDLSCHNNEYLTEFNRSKQTLNPSSKSIAAIPNSNEWRTTKKMKNLANLPTESDDPNNLQFVVNPTSLGAAADTPTFYYGLNLRSAAATTATGTTNIDAKSSKIDNLMLEVQAGHEGPA